jgi:HSP20 family protein
MGNLAGMSRTRDPFANFERMRRQIDELFGDAWTRAGLAQRRTGFRPRVDVYYSDSADDRPKAVIKADLAGVASGDVSIEVRGHTLVITGERKARDAEGRVYQQIEIESGPFRREIQLGVEVVAEEARATYEDGILRVEVPLATPDQGRQVPISDRPSAEGGGPSQ